MRQAMKQSGERISIDQYRALPAATRPANLRCPGAAAGTPCEREVWAGALESQVVTAYFAAHHIAGCDEGAAPVQQEAGDAGHDHAVVVAGVLNVTLEPAARPGGGTRQTPDDAAEGNETRRLRPAGPGEAGQSQDAAPRLRTVLRDLITTGFDPDLIVRCPKTQNLHRAADYFVPLETGRGTTGWRMFYGRIASTFINVRTRSLGIIPHLNGEPSGRELTVYVPPYLQEGFLGRITQEQLEGRWIIVLDHGRGGHWIKVEDPTYVALLMQPRAGRPLQGPVGDGLA